MTQGVWLTISKITQKVLNRFLKISASVADIPKKIIKFWDFDFDLWALIFGWWSEQQPSVTLYYYCIYALWPLYYSSIAKRSTNQPIRWRLSSMKRWRQLAGVQSIEERSFPWIWTWLVAGASRAKLPIYWDFHPQPAPVSSSCTEDRSCWCEASGQDAIMLLLLNSHGYFKVEQLPIKMKTMLISLQVPAGALHSLSALSVSFRGSLLGILFYYHSLKVANVEKEGENRDIEWNLLYRSGL